MGKASFTLNICVTLPSMVELSFEAFSASVQCHWFSIIHLTPVRLVNMAVSTGFSRARLLELKINISMSENLCSTEIS